jgi:hypothetical protein
VPDRPNVLGVLRGQNARSPFSRALVRRRNSGRLPRPAPSTDTDPAQFRRREPSQIRTRLRVAFGILEAETVKQTLTSATLACIISRLPRRLTRAGTGSKARRAWRRLWRPHEHAEPRLDDQSFDAGLLKGRYLRQARRAPSFAMPGHWPVYRRCGLDTHENHNASSLRRIPPRSFVAERVRAAGRLHSSPHKSSYGSFNSNHDQRIWLVTGDSPITGDAKNGGMLLVGSSDQQPRGNPPAGLPPITTAGRRFCQLSSTKAPASDNSG